MERIKSLYGAMLACLLLMVLLQGIFIGCRMYEDINPEDGSIIPEEPEEPDLTPLKLEITESPIWATVGEEKEFSIVSNKRSQVTYTVKQGSVILKKASFAEGDKKTVKEEGVIAADSKITLQKGKNIFSVFTKEPQEKGILLDFKPIEKNTNDEDQPGEAPLIKSLQLKVWTDTPDGPDFKIELTHDTPDTLFLQYQPVKFQFRIKSTSTDHRGRSYSYEYEIIQGDALVRVGSAAPQGTKIAPRERKNMRPDETITLYATPLTTEPTWVRIIVRNKGGDQNFVGAFLNMDYIRPRGLPAVSFTSIRNLGTKGDPYECENNANDKENHCRGNKFFYFFKRMTRVNIGGTCFNTGIEENGRVRYRIGLRQAYYVPNQKYRLLANTSFINGEDTINYQELAMSFVGGHTEVIDYDYLLARGGYLEFDLLMPNHSNLILNGEEAFFKNLIEVELRVLGDNSAELSGRDHFDVHFIKFSSCQVRS